ncbi:cytochrome P450 [Amycolatopsis rhizosphaerae]|uniref:Cytochrome P450 n=1 Tax=Amycolatopsis rhizosphaerae TaxID=2053003 RepID=A0A558D3X6_9PSEU|nr:cytochrome P450 [Amycolatopsis rhizosphaerae]TVT55696.1 cytochrome P450 [Amycolatopsis rhizosphaerae]
MTNPFEDEDHTSPRRARAAREYVPDLGNPDLYRTDARFAMWRDYAVADEPVWSEPGSSPHGFWSVFSHEACRRVLAPSAPFTSEYGMMIGFDAETPDRAGGRMLVVTDGDHHTRLRRLITPFLSRTNATTLDQFIDAEVRKCLSEAVRAGRVDVAMTVGPRLPAAVVCEILGVPPNDRERLVELTNHAFGGSDGTFDKMTPSEAHSEILMYFYELVERRRSAPGDDLVSTLLSDGRLSVQDVLFNCDNVLIGGNETTRHSITGCFHALSTVPGALDRLRADPALIRTAVEEVIRWTSPAMHVLRVATEEVEVSGRVLPAGSPVVAWLPAANRDERVFPHPQRFLLDRQPNKHLGFGNGPHHCLGAALARAGLAALLRVLVEQVRSITLTGPPEWLRSNLTQGYLHLPVELDPMPSAFDPGVAAQRGSR